MTPEKKNIALLLCCQALSMTSMTVLFTVAALVGKNLAPDQSLATLPLAFLQVAVMAATIPASLLMRKAGRRIGFTVGTLIGMFGAGLGAIAIFTQSFPIFILGTTLLGIFNGFSGYYRFAAADAASEAFRSQAISLVVAGGVVAAIVGPGLASWSKDWFNTSIFAGSLLAIIGLQCLNLLLLTGVNIPPIPADEQQKTGRSLQKIAQQPVFLVSVLGGMIGYGVMVFLMTATPLAMDAIPHPFHHTATVIQWHVLGMFAPSFCTGFLIARFGVLTIILTGIALNLLCVAVNLAGTSVLHFLVALAFLGIGWNFMFVGSTTLLTEAYFPEEKAKIQAANDFLIAGFVATATFLSGNLLNRYGWATLNWCTLPMLLLALVAILWLQNQRRSLAPIHDA